MGKVVHELNVRIICCDRNKNMWHRTVRFWLAVSVLHRRSEMKRPSHFSSNWKAHKDSQRTNGW